jgi:hypothetical protein
MNESANSERVILELLSRIEYLEEQAIIQERKLLDLQYQPAVSKFSRRSSGRERLLAYLKSKSAIKLILLWIRKSSIR